MRLEVVTATNMHEIQRIMAEPDTNISVRGDTFHQDTEIVQLLIRVDSEAIGYVNFHSIDTVGRTAWVATFIKEQYRSNLKQWNDVYRELINRAWNKLNLRKLYADTFKNSVKHLLERAGWVREGCLKQSRYIDGEYVDHCIYVLDRKQQ